MKINVLIEGGLGDVILATRFIAAVREKYEGHHITVFVNNENNTRFNDFLHKHWGHLWDAFCPEVERESKTFIINSQFGQENYPAGFGNIKKEWREKILNADKFYDFHLDALKFMKYDDIPVAKFMRCVPTPHNVTEVPVPQEKFVVVNLYSRADHFSGITSEQSDAIISSLRELHPVVVIAPTEEAKTTFYKKHEDLVRVADLEETLAIISRSALGISLDTGLRCMFYPFGKPCLTLCKLCPAPFEIPASHQARWYMWPEHMFPIDTKPSYLSALADGIIENPACAMYPQIPASQIDQRLIIRKYD